jgi:hypothetical protein
LQWLQALQGLQALQRLRWRLGLLQLPGWTLPLRRNTGVHCRSCVIARAASVWRAR